MSYIYKFSRQTLCVILILVGSMSHISAQSAAKSDSISAVPAIENTLLDITKAGSIRIYSSGSITTITVEELDNTDDNFYYETEMKKISDTNSVIQVNSNDIKDVIVTETPSKVAISYVDSEGNDKEYMFVFQDPENRTQSSYIGRRWSDFAINLANSGNVKWEAVTMGLSIGWVTSTKPSPDFGNSMGSSVELSWLMVAGVEMKYRAFSVAAGLGIDWRNFVTNGDRYFLKHPDGKISLQPYSPEMTDRRSRIKVFSLQLPVLATVRFGRKGKWGITAGPVVNFNTSGSIKTQYKIADDSYSIKTSHIGQRPVTVDAYLAFHFEGIGLYARYSPMNMLKTSTSLDFGAFSTGFVLLF